MSMQSIVLTSKFISLLESRLWLVILSTGGLEQQLRTAGVNYEL